MLDEHLLAIRTQFPYAEVKTIKHAGHWIHSDDPELFGQMVMELMYPVYQAGVVKIVQ